MVTEDLNTKKSEVLEKWNKLIVSETIPGREVGFSVIREISENTSSELELCRSDVFWPGVVVWSKM